MAMPASTNPAVTDTQMQKSGDTPDLEEFTAVDTGSRSPVGSVGLIIAVIAFTWSAFQLYVSSAIPFWLSQRWLSHARIWCSMAVKSALFTWRLRSASPCWHILYSSAVRGSMYPSLIGCWRSSAWFAACISGVLQRFHCHAEPACLRLAT